MADDKTSSSLGLWKDMGDLQVKYLDSLGNYQLHAAQADLADAQAGLTTAQAAHELEKVQELKVLVEAKRRVVKQCELDFARLTQARRKNEQHIQQIANMAKNADMIRSGEHLDVELQACLWQGYMFFRTLAPQSSLDKIDLKPIPEDARSGDNYVLLRDKDATCEDVPAKRKTVGQLIEWVRSQHYMPEIGTAAYSTITTAFSALAEVAQPEITKLQTALEQMQKGTYDAWKPVDILQIGLEGEKAKSP
jgi:hypothetical protein